jgi:predicted dehydrogenase
MTDRVTRRHFLQGAAALAASATLTGALPAKDKKAAPSERLNLGIIGVAGRGAANLEGVSSENIVALCDVDLNRAGPARQKFPKAQFYQDFRRLLDQKDVEGVVISTPDHMHAIPAVWALRAGKHVYCEKPLSHSVHEGRAIMQAAAQNQLVTQMGTQIHAENNYRRVVEIIRSGTLGAIRRVHVWCNRRPDPGLRAKTDTPSPAGLDYDLWLGPAPYRPYHESHLHFNWRWWWDFGGGILADMACHYIDLPHWALDLRSPTTVVAMGKKTYEGDNRVPDFMQVDYEYPARGELPPVHLTWYHGVTGPDLNGKVTYVKDKKFISGVLFEGEKGQLVADYNHYQLLPEDRFRDFQPPRPSIPDSIGHHREWIEAIKQRGPTTCNFEYSGLLSETVLLGNVAYRCGQKLVWDAKAGRVTNNVPEAAEFLQRAYRKGWKL